MKTLLLAILLAGGLSTRAHSQAWSTPDSVTVMLKRLDTDFFGCSIFAGAATANAILLSVKGASATTVLDSANRGLACPDSVRRIEQKPYRQVRDSIKSTSLSAAFKEYYSMWLSALDALKPTSAELSYGSRGNQLYDNRILKWREDLKQAANRVKAEL